MTQAIKTLLIANRGEIALRIIRTCQTLGIRSIAVYSEADAQAPFVAAADDAVLIGAPAPAESYLNVERILAAARQSGADAIHPGYGFLSESSALAAACTDAGLLFIGPSIEALEAMGSKSAAKALVANAGVPLLPGYHGDDQADDTLIAAAAGIGFPLLVKASAGGGGKGMRIVSAAGELPDALAGARREAAAAFGDSRLLLEAYLLAPRHVEVQVLFDQHGHGVYLFDRDCSVQRRHQKIIEEAPAPGIPDSVRKAMGDAAVLCGKSVDYVGAGTVEFLYEGGDRFYFMEMNTRLQVEHPVTEMITGLDLVAWQLYIAQGRALPWAQHELRHKGHAIEARVYAENPDACFLPTTGLLHYLREPASRPGLRVDSGVVSGSEITAWYDPMLAKVIAWGEDRDSARKLLIDGLSDYRAAGVILNTDYVCRVLRHPAFIDAQLTTRFIDQWQEELAQPVLGAIERVALSWLGWLLNDLNADASPWGIADNWRLGPRSSQRCQIRIDGENHSLEYQISSRESAQLWLENESYNLRWKQDNGDAILRLGGKQVRLGWTARGGELTLFALGATWSAQINQFAIQESNTADDGALHAPMHGRVTGICCSANETVAKGAPLVVLEAMKMEHTLSAPANGRITALLCELDTTVVAGQPLVEFVASSDEVENES